MAVAFIVLYVVPSPFIAATLPVLSGKIVYEDWLVEERAKNPAVVTLDLATRTQKIVAAPAMNPRWLPSGREIAYFLPDNTVNGVVEIPDAPEKRLGMDQISRYRAVLPGRTVIISADGERRRELKHFVADIDAAARYGLTIRPSAGQDSTIRSRSGDLLIQDMATGELSTFLTSGEIGNGRGEALRGARWTSDGRSVIYHTERVQRNQFGNLISTWALYVADLNTRIRSELPIASGLPFENTGPEDFAPSSDGRTVAFTVVQDKDLWSFDLNTGLATKIEVGEQGYRKDKPVFSPDGQLLLFELTDQTDAYGTTSFWIAPGRGGRASRVLPRSWRHVIRFLVLQESHHSADWWQPR